MEIVEMSQDQGGVVGCLLPLLPAYQAHWWVLPIHNLSRLNTYLRVAKFRMETLTSILRGLYKGWWMVLLDLKDAYLYVSIHHSHWQYLQFAPRNAAGQLFLYQWKVLLLFGLVTTHRVYQTFGPCGSSASAWMTYVSFYRQHIPCAGICQPGGPYLQPQFPCHFRFGFIINLQKSALIYSQVMLHIGTFDRHSQELGLPLP